METQDENTLHSPNQTEGDEESGKGSGIRVFFQTALVTLVIILSAYLVYGVYDYYHEPQFQTNEIIEELPAPSPTPENHKQESEEPESALPHYENQVGILTVDGVDVTNEPIMQHPTEDEYYLYKNEEGKYSIWGSYYVYHDWNMSSIENLDKVTVIFVVTPTKMVHEFAKSHFALVEKVPVGRLEKFLDLIVRFRVHHFHSFS